MIYYLLTPLLALITHLWLECVYKAWGSRLMYRDFRYACLAALAVSAIIIPTIMFAIFIAEGGLTAGYPTTIAGPFLSRYNMKVEHIVMLGGVILASGILKLMHPDDLRGGDQYIAGFIPFLTILIVYFSYYIQRG